MPPSVRAREQPPAPPPHIVLSLACTETSRCQREQVLTAPFTEKGAVSILFPSALRLSAVMAFICVNTSSCSNFPPLLNRCREPSLGAQGPPRPSARISSPRTVTVSRQHGTTSTRESGRVQGAHEHVSGTILRAHFPPMHLW